MGTVRRHLLRGVIASVLAVCGIGLRMAYVGHHAAAIHPLAAHAQSEFERVSAVINQSPGSTANQTGLAVTPSRPEITEPKVIEIEYDEEGNAIAGQLDDPASESGDAGRSNRTDRLRNAVRDLGGPTFRADDWHYTVGIPFGWSEMPTMELSQMNQGVRMLGLGAQVSYQAGFRRRKTRPGTCPYILVSAKKGQFNSYDEVERALKSELPRSVKFAEKAIKNVADNVSIHDAAVDRTNNRVTFRSEVDVHKVGTIKALSVGHIGSQGVVFVHSYALEKEFNRWLPTFERINDSFEFDEGFEFVEKSAKPGKIDDLATLLPAATWILGGLLGGGAGALMGLMLLSLRKRPRRPQLLSEAHTAMYANGASPNGLEAHGVAAQRPMEAHGTYLDNFRDLTPPRTIDVVRRMFSWAMVLAVCSGGGWGVYRYGPEFKEKWPEMKVSATNWWFELTTGQTPTDVLSGTNTQGQVLTR